MMGFNVYNTRSNNIFTLNISELPFIMRTLQQEFQEIFIFSFN